MEEQVKYLILYFLIFILASCRQSTNAQKEKPSQNNKIETNQIFEKQFITIEKKIADNQIGDFEKNQKI